MHSINEQLLQMRWLKLKRYVVESDNVLDAEE